MFAEEEADLLIDAATEEVLLEELAARRIAGEPLEQVVGWASFRGLRIVVEPGVFVPRRRTELLVEEALPLVPPDGVVVDLCCGTGAVGAAIGTELTGRGVTIVAADLDPVEVRCARRNIAGLGTVYEGDLFEPLPRELERRVNVLVVNAPYVPTAEIALMPPEARDHEPALALDGGADGLDLHRRVAAGAATWLTSGGSVLIEVSVRQAQISAALFTAEGFDVRVVHSDDLDGTAVVATRAAT